MHSLSFGVPIHSTSHDPGIPLQQWDALKGKDAAGGGVQERWPQKLREARWGKF